MKKLILLLVILFIPSLVSSAELIQLARMSPLMVSGGAAGSCSQSTIFEQTTQSTDFGIARTGRNYCFSSFSVTGSSTARHIELYVKKAGTPTSCNAGVLAICDWDAGNNRCGTTCTNFSDTFNIASVSTSYGYNIKSNLSAGYALTTGRYCARLYCASVEASGTDLNIKGNTAATGEYIGYGTDGTAYTTTSNTQWNMVIKSCTE